LIPATVPLSIEIPVPSVVGDVHLVRSPVTPPVSEDEIPSDEVATHCVDVPVDQRTWPRVPEADTESRNTPVRLRLVVKRSDAVKADADAVENVACPVTPRVPARPRVKAGEEEAMPTLPFASILKSVELVDDATVKRSCVVVPVIASIETGEVVPMPTLPPVVIRTVSIPLFEIPIS
jgi:hypothetical protein